MVSYLVHGGDKPGGGRGHRLEPAPGAAGGGVYNLHKMVSYLVHGGDKPGGGRGHGLQPAPGAAGG
jgi:hypothetical protein